MVAERGRLRERWVYSRIVRWYEVSQAPVRLVIVRDPRGREPDNFFFAEDPAMTEAEIVGDYAEGGASKIHSSTRNR